MQLLSINRIVARPLQALCQTQPDELGLRAVRDADCIRTAEGEPIKLLRRVELEADGPLRLLLPRHFVEGLERLREEPAVAARLLVAIFR